MRTTITLDDDVAAKLTSLARRTGRAFREVVNETLRRGLARPPATSSRQRFVVNARDLGPRRPGISLDSVADLIDQTEGPLHR
ncbi:MAG: ribbon-helix-helix protein, CopG family [Acidobacteria bacterium]|nr:MAG: ribbon-helix-helix protein, CopG family [Acidobacteriota bacterium]